MNPRLLIALTVATTAASAALGEPAPGTHRIAFVNLGPADANAKNFQAFRDGLAELGYIEGRNVVLDVRWANGDPGKLPSIVQELLAHDPKIVVSTGGPSTVRAVKNATSTVPVVFITGNPVAEGVAATLARPGANLTGFAVLAGELEAKRLELLKQMVPSAKRVAVLWNPAQPSIEGIVERVNSAGASLGLVLIPSKARNVADLDAAFKNIAAAKADALFVVADPVLGFERARIVDFANRNKLPAMYFWREFVEAGGLASYGTVLPDVYRRLAVQIDKILKGARAGELAIQQPTQFELAVNRDTVRALGVTIPPNVLQRVDVFLP
jgi:putative ABC transport system substrate-binding protein